MMCASFIVNAQSKSLDDIIKDIENANPSLKMYDAEVQSMDAAAKGAWSWDRKSVV